MGNGDAQAAGAVGTLQVEMPDEKCQVRNTDKFGKKRF